MKTFMLAQLLLLSAFAATSQHPDTPINLLQTDALNLVYWKEPELSLKWERSISPSASLVISAGFLAGQGTGGLKQGHFEQEYVEVLRDGCFYVWLFVPIPTDCYDNEISYPENKPWKPVREEDFRRSAFYGSAGVHNFFRKNPAPARQRGPYYSFDFQFAFQKYTHFEVKDKTKLLNRVADDGAGLFFVVLDGVHTVTSTYHQSRTVEKRNGSHIVFGLLPGLGYRFLLSKNLTLDFNATVGIVASTDSEYADLGRGSGEGFLYRISALAGFAF